jgi:hypothetical protein
VTGCSRNILKFKIAIEAPGGDEIAEATGPSNPSRVRCNVNRSGKEQRAPQTCGQLVQHSGHAIVTAGTFVPAAQFVFNILPPEADLALIYGLGGVCIVAGVLIHLFGQWILGGLE